MNTEADRIAEMRALKCELDKQTDRRHKAELEKEQYMKKIDELEKERQFLLGQIAAFRCCLKGGEG